MTHRVLDPLTRDLTGFVSFDAMINAAGDYRPTMRVRPCSRSSAEIRRAARTAILADAYDAAQAERGDARRAYRGGGH